LSSLERLLSHPPQSLVLYSTVDTVGAFSMQEWAYCCAQNEKLAYNLTVYLTSIRTLETNLNREYQYFHSTGAVRWAFFAQHSFILKPMSFLFSFF